MTLRVTTMSGVVHDFPDGTAVVDEYGALWVGDDAALEADRKGKPSTWDAYFAPSTVEYTRFIDEG